MLPPEANYIGIDTARTLEEFGYRVPDTTYYDGKRWPLDDGSVDVVLATETIEHVESISEFFSEAARCVRPGGRLILTVPFAARWHFIPYDYWRFTPSGLIAILRLPGLYRRSEHGLVAKLQIDYRREAPPLCVPIALVYNRVDAAY